MKVVKYQRVSTQNQEAENQLKNTNQNLLFLIEKSRINF